MEGPPPLRHNHLTSIEREPGSIPREKTPSSGILGTLAAIGVLIAKSFAPIVKFLPIILKTGGTMLLSIGLYAIRFGWLFAIGFVLLILVHECGHLVAARRFGLKVGAPVFIPFMGALIALKEAPRHAWIEAWVGIGGPILGSIGALVCHALGEQLNSPLLISLAAVGYWLNLFNLVPVGQLDGGRIVTALSPWLWLPGVALMGFLSWRSYADTGHVNLIMLFVLVMAIPRVVSLFRQRSDEERRYFEVTRGQRLTVALCYFGLMAALALGMHVTEVQLRTMGAV